MSQADAFREMLEGVAPLRARTEPWQRRLLADPDRLADLLDKWGSPLNLIDPGPMERNLDDLAEVAAAQQVPFRAFFARKANKAISLVDRALELGAGIDVAGEAELEQALARGATGPGLIVTAAVKPRALLELAAGCGAVVALDNEDEFELARSVAAERRAPLPVAFRLAVSGAAAARPSTRFGLPAGEIAALAARLPARRDPDARSAPTVEGIHFHVDGYNPGDRVAGVREALGLADELRALGHEVRWLDIGGGIPMRYLGDPGEWDRFWEEQRSALRGLRAPLTYLGHGLGVRRSAPGEVEGDPAVYPVGQSLTRGPWLEQVLGAPAGDAAGGSVADALRERDLELRCEPGRSLLDGCGMTIARVAFRKRGADGDRLIGLEMNRTQMRTTSDDSMLDPFLLRPGGAGEPSEAGEEGYLVGAYCIERELLSWRRFRFERGVAVGDLVAFPNTAGYFMHILESSSHQMPLARNVVVGAGGEAALDPIDA